MKEFFTEINSVTPFGLCVLLGYVIYLLISKSRLLMTNHLHGLPDMAATLVRIEETLGQIRDGINYLKGKVS